MTNSQLPRHRPSKRRVRKAPSSALRLFSVRALSGDEFELLSGYAQVWLEGVARTEINDAVANFVQRVAARTLMPTPSDYRVRLEKASAAARSLIALFAPTSNKKSEENSFNIEAATYAILLSLNNGKRYGDEVRCVRRLEKLCDAAAIQVSGQKGRLPKTELSQFLVALIWLAAELHAPLELPGNTPLPAHDLDDEWNGQTPLFRFLRHALEISVDVGVAAVERAPLSTTQKDRAKTAIRSYAHMSESSFAKHLLRARRRATG